MSRPRRRDSLTRDRLQAINAYTYGERPQPVLVPPARMLRLRGASDGADALRDDHARGVAAMLEGRGSA